MVTMAVTDTPVAEDENGDSELILSADDVRVVVREGKLTVEIDIRDPEGRIIRTVR